MDGSNRNLLNNPEYIIAFSVALISICALVVCRIETTIMSEQRALMHEQAKASVWPRLSLGVSKGHNTDDNSLINYQITVVNAGVGPAIIKHVRVLYKDAPKNGWGDLFLSFDLPEDIPRYISNATLSQSIIRHGESLQFLSLKENLPLAEILYANTENVRFEIYYESIYEDQWKYTVGLDGDEESTEEIIPAIEDFNSEEAFVD